jgi:hypothetical protein
MGSSGLPNTALLGENRLDDERCGLHPDTSPSVSTMSRDMRPLSPELRHPITST